MTNRTAALFNSSVPASAGEADYAARLARIERFSRWLDGRWQLPGTRYTFGWDAVIGLIPGVGDVAGMGCSLYVLYEGMALGVPLPALFRMLANVGVDGVVGAVPLLGDVFDFGWKANQRNAAIVREHAIRNADGRARVRSAGRIVRFALLLVVSSIGLTIALTTGLLYLLVS